MLSNSIYEIGKEAIENGLVDEFLSRSNNYRNHFCNGMTNKIKGNKTCIAYLMAQAYLAKGNLSKAYEYLLDSNEGYKYSLNGVDQYWDKSFYIIFYLSKHYNGKNLIYKRAQIVIILICRYKLCRI